jgi:hypothetical protein
MPPQLRWRSCSPPPHCSAGLPPDRLLLGLFAGAALLSSLTNGPVLPFSESWIRFLLLPLGQGSWQLETSHRLSAVGVMRSACRRDFVGNHDPVQTAEQCSGWHMKRMFRSPYHSPSAFWIVRKLVGVAGFEPATPTSRTWCAAEPS